MPDATASILLLGATGQVGHALRRTLAPLGRVHTPGRAAVDLTDLTSVRAAVRELGPDLVVNAAAYTDVDGAEEEPGRAARINAEAPRVLAEAARAVGAWLVHYSTDYVFGGTKRAPYTEADAPSPISVYGRTKRDGEAAIQAVGGRHLILRTSWVYSRRRSNFVRTMLGLAAENDRLTVVDDQIGVPTWAGWCAEATASVCERLLADDAAPEAGCYHLAGTGQTSWYGLARAVFAQFGRTDVAAQPVSSDEYETAAPRPAYTVLDSSRARAAFDLPATTWTAQLDRFRKRVRTAGGERLARG
ncbi:dTDP-4-dehydrorhamnose reductase [Salinibacter ruber]|uniref:dTDP-4-dehydrorhamnose reductase n=1 Tax=Salinibacter ruber (strain DSM 13855 / M31) TaxID=309807 RepID=Q2S4Z7_SALRD|nr:dTDP-4-dehydrorhamnose reductase [Salinibacter ruber]ABC43891.1 dTDP-4-dehydrorhamnose reductase [Salinibacter ruber DSM 13855]